MRSSEKEQDEATHCCYKAHVKGICLLTNILRLQLFGIEECRHQPMGPSEVCSSPETFCARADDGGRYREAANHCCSARGKGGRQHEGGIEARACGLLDVVHQVLILDTPTLKTISAGEMFVSL